MNTHFDHRGKQARIESARLLKSKTEELAEGKQVILTGDFNSLPESEAIQTIKSGGLLDSREVATITYGPEWTSTGFKDRPFENRRIIDYIFLHNIKTVNRHAIFTEKLNDLYLSDHCPVFVQIEL